MQDINQMNFGMPQQNEPRKKTGTNHISLAGIIAAAECAVIVVLAIVLVMTKVAKNDNGLTAKEDKKVREAVEVYRNLYFRRTVRLSDCKWEDYYPDEIADYMIEQTEEYTDEMADEMIDEMEDELLDNMKINILSVSRINNDDADAGEYLQDTLKELLDDVPDIDYDEDEIRAEEGYLVLSSIKYEGEERYAFFMVLKVNGRYGLYDICSPQHYLYQN